MSRRNRVSAARRVGRAVGAATIVIVGACASATTAFAQPETTVQIAAGTYSLSTVVTKSGTATNWIRYKATTPGSVRIRGGGVLENRQYVILDGFIIDQRLDPEYPSWASNLQVVASHNIIITNTEFLGPHDIHTGFDVTGAQNCQESTGFPTVRGSGIRTEPTSSNITLSNVVIHGFYDAATLDGQHDRVVNSLFRNNHNGISFGGQVKEIIGNVFWVHPNHPFSIKHGVKKVVLQDNLVVDAQEVLYTDSRELGVDELIMVNNTFWVPANKPCYGMDGANLTNVHTRGEVRNNIFVNDGKPFLVVSGTGAYVQSNYNLFYYYGSSISDEFEVGAGPVRFETWRSITGEDANSIARQQPQFVDPPRYGDSVNQWGFRTPRSVAEARAWFALTAGPGKGAGPAGQDTGIGVTGSLPGTPAPQPPTNPRIIR